MQQQICQPEQMQGQQQQPQQVMLCPVRLIYETQILLQPGEQIQPNQTLFINPQNPPPWIQNRAQNQVIYMQQLPNNMMSSVPQPIDQNQMYLQNLQNYYPQQMIQVDQMRQMPNVVQMMPNINNINQIATQNVSNMGQNVSLNVQNVNNIGPNGLNAAQNVMPMTNVVQNVSQKPANVGVNIAQNVSNDRLYNPANVMPNALSMATHQTTMTSVNQMQDRSVNMNQNLVNMQKVAELQGMRQNVKQPQVTVNPMQNVKFAQNANVIRNDVRPISTPTVGDTRSVMSPRQMNVPTISNIPNNVAQANALNKKVPVPNKQNSSVMPNQVRHYNQTYYRPIQPRSMSVMPMAQNQYAPTATQSLNVQRPNQIINDVSRKRKSESPDETRKKIPNTNNHTMSTTPVSNQAMTIVPTTLNKIANVVQSDISVNTSPVHKQVRLVETASTGTQANIAKEKTQMNETRVVNPIVNDNIQSESDKLVRNTVFTQARGLLRTEPIIMQPDIISIEKIENVNPSYNVEKFSLDTRVKIEEAMKLEASKPNTEIVRIETSTNTEVKTTGVFKQEVQLKKEEPPIKEAGVKLKIVEAPKPEPVAAKPVKPDTKEIKEVKEVSKEVKEVGKEVKEVSKEVKDVSKDVKDVSKEVKDVSNEISKEVNEVSKEVNEVSKEVNEVSKEVKKVSKKFTVTAISDFKGNEIQIADGSVRKEDTDSYILTHVLDGYVIQESNTAFPIRKPLKEKTIYQNTDLTMDQKKEETPYKHRTEDGKIIKDNSKILTISDLNLNEDDNKKTEEKTEEDIDEDHPFANLKPSAIKSWTVDELATHLAKHKWTDTISVLSEHEIDGESLFLVSKQQLVHIGVNETHAEVICEFIKKT